MLAKPINWLEDAIKSGSLAHTKHHFVILDALRGVAAFFVIFRHFPAIGARHPWPLSFIAVDFFFVLSGFVLEPGFSKDGKPVPLKVYILGRAIRVWPTYLLGVLIALVAQYWVPQENERGSLLAQVPGALLLLPLYKGPSSLQFPIMGPAWSLFAEFWIANLLFAALYARMKRKYIIAVVFVSSIAMAALVINHGNADFGFTWSSIPATIVRVIFSFSFGCLLRSYRGRLQPMLSKWLFPTLCALLAFIFYLPLANNPLFQLVILVIFFPGIVWCGSFVKTDRIGDGVAKILGDLSYPLYALHDGLGMVVAGAMATFGFSFPHSTFMFAVLFLPISWLVARYYDAPVRLYLRRKLLAAPSRISGELPSHPGKAGETVLPPRAGIRFHKNPSFGQKSDGQKNAVSLTLLGMAVMVLFIGGVLIGISLHFLYKTISG